MRTANGYVQAPPMGMRSAVPLGGVGAGTLELRADGTFADWMIEGQGTALATDAVHNSKIPLKDEAILAIYSSTQSTTGAEAGAEEASMPVAMTLRTSPPPGLPGVDGGLAYSGSYPFSRHVVSDTRLPFAASLFSYSTYAASQPATASGLPAIFFSLLVEAPAGTAPTNVSLLLSLPLGSSVDTARPLVNGDLRNQTLATLTGVNSSACLARCDAYGPACVWWAHTGPDIPNTTLPDHDCPGNDIMTPPRVAVATLTDCIAQCLQRVPGCVGVVLDQIAAEQQGQCGNTNASLHCCLPKSACSSFTPKPGDTLWSQGSSGNVCTLYRGAPAVEQFQPGTGLRTGVRGYWAPSASGLGLERPNQFDSSAAASAQDPAAATASYTLRAVDADVEVTYAAGNSLVDDIFTDFAASGQLGSGQQLSPVMAAHGAIAAKVLLQPGQTRTITLVLAWHLPDRMYVGQRLGSAYTALFNSSSAVADHAAAHLRDIVSAAASWNRLWATASLPDWMRDFLANSVAVQTKMSVWVNRGVDLAPHPGGRFRSFEAYSNCDLAPVHVLDYAMLPLALYLPELLQNELLSGWATRQNDDGMIQEFLGTFNTPDGRLTGTMDLSAGGRVMGDVTTVFILATLACMRSTNDTDFLDAIWPHVAAAADWQIRRAGTAGCPTYLQNTYDYLGLDQYPYTTYTALLHNAAMRATVVLGQLAGDVSGLADAAKASEAACLGTLGRALWHSNVSSAPQQGSSTGEAGLNSSDAGASAGWWRAWQDAQGGAPNLILSGSLHGQSWASALGLGLLVPLENITQHTLAERALNCAYSPQACELGLLSLPGHQGTWTMDASPSQSMDATVMRILAGLGGLDGSPAEAVVELYRTHNADFWDFKDLHVGPNGLDCGGADLHGAALAGQPFVNAHYGRQLQGWAALLALTGQQYDATSGTLSLSPVCDGWEPDVSVSGRADGGRAPVPAYNLHLPVLTPHALVIVSLHWSPIGANNSLDSAQPNAASQEEATHYRVAPDAMLTGVVHVLSGSLPAVTPRVSVHLQHCRYPDNRQGEPGQLLEVPVEPQSRALPEY